MNDNEWLNRLLALQKIDLVVKNQLNIIDNLEAYLNKLLICIDNCKKNIDKMFDEINLWNNEINLYDNKVLQIKAKIEELKERGLLKIKQNTYDALNIELEKKQNENHKILQEKNNLIDKIKDYNNKIKDYNFFVENLHLKINKKIEKAKIKLDNYKIKLDKNTNIRRRIIKNISDNYIQPYLSIKRKYDKPLTMIKNNNICENCNIQLTSQIINDVNNGIFTICESCGHILYIINEKKSNLIDK